MHGLHVSPRPRLGDVLARRRLRPRTRVGPARRDVPRDRGAARVRPPSTRGSASATSTSRPTCSGRRSLAAGETLRAVTAAVARAVRRRRRASLPMTRRPGDHADLGGRRRRASSTSTSRSTGSARGARDEVKAVRFEGVERSRPAPGRARGDRRRGRDRAVPVEPGRVDRSDPRGAGGPRRRRGSARPRRRRVADRRRRAARGDGGPADAGGRRSRSRRPAPPTCYAGCWRRGWSTRPTRALRRARSRRAGVRAGATDTIMRDDDDGGGARPVRARLLA